MRIAIFPAHHDGAASARIRAFTLQKALRSLGHDARLREAGEADVVFIQKTANRQILSIAEQAKKRGALILYDMDDVGPEIWYFIAPSILRRLLLLADCVTTDTEGHRSLLLRSYGIHNVAVVPDTIDYYPTGPVPPSTFDGTPLRVLWFGNAANIALFAKYERVLADLPDVEVVVATNTGAIEGLSREFPRVSFVPWSKDTFVDLLRSCAVTVLSHDGSETDRAKSNNRMIASITWGVPAVVSRTPEYERTAAECGVEFALFSNRVDLPTVVERFRTAASRREYLGIAQPRVWDRYAPEIVAQRFLQVVGLASRREAPALPSYIPWLCRAARGHIGWALRREAIHVASRFRHALAAEMLP